MKYNCRFFLAVVSFIIFFTLLSFPVFAQSVDCPDLPDPDVPCPIDSGLIWLLAIGLFYGIKKLINQINLSNHNPK